MASLTNRHIKDTYQDLLTTENNLLQSGLGDPVEVNMSGSSFISASISGDGFSLGTGSDNTVLSSSFSQTSSVALGISNIQNFADDTAAAAGGILIGGIYRTVGDLKVRIA